MIVRLNECWGEYPPGTVLTPASDALARHLVDVGIAVRIDPEPAPEVETTMQPEPESPERNASRRAARRRARKA